MEDLVLRRYSLFSAPFLSHDRMNYKGHQEGAFEIAA